MKVNTANDNFRPCVRRVGIFHWAVIAFAALAYGASIAPVRAQQEFTPPQGKGRVIVVASGQSGPSHYTKFSEEIAKLGYDVVLFDSNPMVGTHGAALKADIIQAQQMPHALPGKVGLVGCSLGGGIALGYGATFADLVAVDVDWYPATSEIKDIPAMVGHWQVPILMFAGESDTYKNCCLVDTARQIEAEAKNQKATYQLFTYSGVQHDFVVGGAHYDAKAYGDAMQRMTAILTQYMK